MSDKICHKCNGPMELFDIFHCNETDSLKAFYKCYCDYPSQDFDPTLESIECDES